MDDGALVLSNNGVLMSSQLDENVNPPVKQNRKLIAILVVFIIIILTAYIFSGGEQRRIKKCAELYFTAIVDRDFDTIFKYHAPSQKRIAVAMKYPDTKNARVKEIYDEQEKLFEYAQPANNIKEMWSEKFLIVKEMKYNITAVKMVEDIENPNSPIRERIDALMEVESEYTNKETAPDLNGKIKKVTYLVRMVHSRNVIRTSVKEPRIKIWLFKSIDVKEGRVYW